MKKIGKINLKNVNASEFFSESEMKRVVGGYGNYGDSGGGADCKTAKVDACAGKSDGVGCSFTCEGSSYSGVCRQVPFNSFMCVL